MEVAVLVEVYGTLWVRVGLGGAVVLEIGGVGGTVALVWALGVGLGLDVGGGVS